nr:MULTISPECIES: hypothetical protein [Streptomyces]
MLPPGQFSTWDLKGRELSYSTISPPLSTVAFPACSIRCRPEAMTATWNSSGSDCRMSRGVRCDSSGP